MTRCEIEAKHTAEVVALAIKKKISFEAQRPSSLLSSVGINHRLAVVEYSVVTRGLCDLRILHALPEVVFFRQDGVAKEDASW